MTSDNIVCTLRAVPFLVRKEKIGGNSIQFTTLPDQVSQT